MNNKREYGFDTLSIHHGYSSDQPPYTCCVPIYQSNAYNLGDTENASELFELNKAGNIYTRLTNPTNAILESRMAALEGGAGAVAVSSGHAAIFQTIINLASQGDEIVSSINIYGGAVNLLGVTLGNLGIKTKFVDPDNFEEWEKAVTDRTKAFFVEIIGNPNANLADIQRISNIAHKYGIPLIVDSTFATPYLFKAFEYGADIVVHSATKYLCGHGNSMCGIIVDSGKFEWEGNRRFSKYNQPDKSYHGKIFAKDFGNAGFITRLRALILRDIGASVSPFNSFMIINGLETLSLRMKKHCENALAVAEYLESNPMVEKVNYPYLKSSKYYNLAKQILPKGCGSVFTLSFKGSRESGIKFINNLQLISNVANVGDIRSMAIHPASTTHSQLTPRQLAEGGITEGTVRLSIGLEDIEDIIYDIEQAVKAIKK